MERIRHLGARGRTSEIQRNSDAPRHTYARGTMKITIPGSKFRPRVTSSDAVKFNNAVYVSLLQVHFKFKRVGPSALRHLGHVGTCACVRARARAWRFSSPKLPPGMPRAHPRRSRALSILRDNPRDPSPDEPPSAEEILWDMNFGAKIGSSAARKRHFVVHMICWVKEK